MPDTFDILNILQQGQQPQQPGQPQANPWGGMMLTPQGVNKSLLNMLHGATQPYRAAESILQQGDKLPSQMSINPGAAGLMAGPGALLPTIGGVTGGLGASGARILQRTDAQKLAKDMLAAGKNRHEIADALNDRFAPLLDEGESINPQQIADRFKAPGLYPRTGRYRTLGAMGGAPEGSGVTPEQLMEWLEQQKPVDKDYVRNWFKESDVPYEEQIKGKRYKTSYFRFQLPYGQESEGAKFARPTVRVPTDAHWSVGERSPYQAGSFFDTGFVPRGGVRSIEPPLAQTTTNISGEPYANRDVLSDALKWKTSKAPHGGNWLISPDRAPMSRPNVQLGPINQEPTPYDPHKDVRQLILKKLFEQ